MGKEEQSNENGFVVNLPTTTALRFTLKEAKTLRCAIVINES
jgi:hypothetical protein